MILLISDFQDYFEFIIKKPETLSEDLPIEIYPNKIKNRIVFKKKTGYKLELLAPETMKLLGSTKKDDESDKNSENVPKLESFEVVLVHCNLVINKCGKKLMGTATKTGIDAAKTASKRVVQKSAEAIGDLIGNKIAVKITSIGKPKEKEKRKEIEEIFIPLEKRQQIIDDLRLF